MYATISSTSVVSTTRPKLKVVCGHNYIPNCKTCKHYSSKDDTCKVLSVLKHKILGIKRLSVSLCRGQEELCGRTPRYYTELTNASTSLMVDSPDEDLRVTYYIDGSSGLSGKNSVMGIEKYYESLHQDFNDVY